MKYKIKKAILVGSSKGGTGKSSLACLIALDMFDRHLSIGTVDLDISGPSIPKILGIKSGLTATENGIQPQKTVDGMPVISIEMFMNSKSTCVLWSSDKKRDYILTILKDVDWNLEYLVADIPPGTDSCSQAIIEYTQDNKIPSGMLFVSSPQEVSLNDISKGISMARRLGMHILGIVENYSMFKCPCGKEHYLFGKGKVEQFCKDNNIKYLGSIPLVPELSEVSDKCLSINTVPKELKPIITKLVDDILKEMK